jgi:hypothetical protein
MFGLYPAGSDWIQHIAATRSARELRKLLTEQAGFSAGMLHQPFGAARGAVIAQKGAFLVLADAIDGEHAELAVVPDVQLQNLLWSFSKGYANQWSDREIKLLTGCDNWDALLRKSKADFAAVCTTVRAAADGSLMRPVEPPTPAPVSASPFPELPDDDDIPWLPSEYLHDAPGPEVMSCAH